MSHAIPYRQPTLFGVALPVLCGVAVFAYASCVLLAWLTGMDANVLVFHVLLQMKANTALCLSLLGVALAVAGSRSHAHRPILLSLIVVLPFCIATVTLLEYALDWDSGTGRLLSPDVKSISHPGRMALLTTVAILLLSLASLENLRSRRASILLSQCLSLTSAALATVTLLGHLYGVSPILHLFGHIPMAWNTAILILLLGIGIATLRPESGPVAPLLSATSSARMGRRLLILVFLTLPLLAWLRMQGQTMQLYSAEFGTALVVATCLVMMSALIMTHTFYANRAEVRVRYLNRIYSVLSEVNSLLMRATNRDELFTEVHRITIERGAFPRAWLGLVNADRTAVSLVAGYERSDLAPERLLARLSLKHDVTGPSPIARAVLSGLPVISNDVTAERNDPFRDDLLAHNIYSFAVFPLILGGETIGVFKLHAEVPNFFHDEELKLLGELAGDIVFALRHLEQKHMLDHLAYFDSLTGLANSRLFEERLSQAIVHTSREQGKLAVIVVDIVDFKAINESCGRNVGDETLKEVAHRINATCGNASNGRLGGNLFGIYLHDIENDGVLVKEIERITDFCFAQRFDLLGNSFALSARAGIAILGRDGLGSKTLLTNAEGALALAKRSGLRYRFHDLRSNERNSERLALQTALIQALDTDEFQLHYQVKVDAKNYAVCGAEALLRWSNLSVGTVEPSRFVPVLEETGLIDKLGVWALRQASFDNSQHISSVLQGFRIAVNISASQILQPDFVETIVSALGEDVAMADIDLEVTESLVMTDIEASIDKLRRLRDLGIKIAIDDFGTGYSSLAYLAKLPLDYLKIDRSFVKGLPADQECVAVISSIISLGHALGLQVIAEGIEHTAQAKLLVSLGCDQLQGYLFGRAVPLADLLNMLKAPNSYSLSFIEEVPNASSL